MAKKSTIYFVNEAHVEEKESLPIKTYESSREFDKATSKEGGVFWGVKSANESSRFSDWGSLNSVDTDEETAKADEKRRETGTGPVIDDSPGSGTF